MDGIEIRLFGAVEIYCTGKQVSGFRSQKSLAILAYLIGENRPISREYLAGLVWPNVPQSQALGLLRRTLHDLIGRLPGCLVVDRRTVHFAPERPVAVDVHTFAALAAQDDPAAWAQAVELPRAPFLEGVYLDDAPELESWLTREQERWQQQMVSLLDRLVALCTAEGVYGDALAHARRLVVLEPWREEAHCRLMLLLARTGQISAALAQYHACRRALWEELAVEPAQSTRILHRRLQNIPRSPSQRLPGSVTPLIGREDEETQIFRLLADPRRRFITLLGVGGIGKTRLALAMARRVVNDTLRVFLHGVIFVPLAGVDTFEQMIVAMAQRLGLTLQGSEAPEVQVLNHLRDRELLLVLDNFEQLIDPQSLHFLVQLLEEAPEAKLLVTSRVRLGLYNEQVYRLQGLSIPTTAVATPAAASSYAGIRLWIETVRRHLPDYDVTADELPALVTIGRQVQGMPLAIELAAGWRSTLSAPEISASLASNLDFLSTDAPDLPERLRSMRAVFQTSWRLLRPPEQAIFPRLAVFRGGFTADLALAVAKAGPDTLAVLQDKSLISRSSEGRYTVHELVRQFAAEQLTATGQMGAIRQRHAAALLAAVEQIDPQARYAGSRPGLAAIAAESENVEAALHWCFAQGQERLGLELVAALRDFWHLANGWRAGSRWQAMALAVPPSDETLPARARVLNERGVLLGSMGEIMLAQAAHRESLGIFTSLDWAIERAWTHYHLACPEYQDGDDAVCNALLFDALAVFRRAGDERGVAAVLQRLALQMLDGEEDLVQTEQFAGESLAIARRLDLRTEVAGTLILLGEVAIRQDNLTRAEAHLAESLSLSGPISGLRSWALGKLGHVLLKRGDLPKAKRTFQEALRIRQELGSIIGVAWMLEALGDVALATGEYSQAVQMFSSANALRTRQKMPLLSVDKRRFGQAVQRARRVLGEEPFVTAWQTGEGLAQRQTDFVALFGSEAESDGIG